VIKILYISDFLLIDLIGGGELNDHELCVGLKKRGFSVTQRRSHEVKIEEIKKTSFYIISNFMRLSREVIEFLKDKCDYIIYEHDHKYLKTRNPALYKDYKADKTQIVNLEFYKKAKKIFCQSSFHEAIMKLNTDLTNTHNVSGNLWSDDALEVIKILNKKAKRNRYSVLNSKTPHKNTRDTVFYCEKKGFKYDLISSLEYQNFLSLLANNDKFIFLPKTPETLSRIVVEARMMNIKTITNKRVGAAHEPWFYLKGEQLIDYMTNKKQEITDKILEVINE